MWRRGKKQGKIDGEKERGLRVWKEGGGESERDREQFSFIPTALIRRSPSLNVAGQLCVRYWRIEIQNKSQEVSGCG